MKDLSKEIEAYALENAIEFGKTEAGRILPKLFQHGLKKEEIKEVMPLIIDIVKNINKLPDKKRKEAFDKLKDVVKKHEEKERDLPELTNAKGKMVFRLAPFPSGALHIGNAKTYLLNALYAEKYNAKLLLVIDDTIGSEEKPPIKEAYGLIEDAFKLLGIKYEKPVIYKSDRLEIYYEYALKLIEKGKVYICHCSAEELRDNRARGVECSCRQFPIKIQLGRWKDMFKLKEGQATLRIKTDMLHANPAFRDRVLFKISDRAHPRVGKRYRVWPTLEMSWAIDDHLLGISHIIRGNDLMIESDMERFIWDIFNWKHAETIHTGLITIENTGKISKSKAQQEVKSGEYIGWDDPRTWSVQSLIRRGITKEAIKEFVKEIGLNKQDIIVPIDTLYAINRKLIDLSSDRYYFVEAPLKISISGKLPEIINIEVHPDKKETRQVKTSQEVFISQNDFNSYKGKEIRLLHLCNLKLKEKTKVSSLENKKIPKIQWISESVKARIFMPDGKWKDGLAESSIESLKKGQVIQFERVGFVRFDDLKDNIYEFWFAHQ